MGGDTLALGEFATVRKNWRVCDLGTGSGALLLLLNRRESSLSLTGIELDERSVSTAEANLAENGLDGDILHTDLRAAPLPAGQFDLVISNPPYFVSSLRSPDAARSIARHTDTLSFDDLTRGVCRLLSPEGHFALILPPPEMERFRSAARGKLFIKRCCEVWSTPTSGAKRIMAEFSSDPTTSNVATEKLIIEDSGPQCYSEEYRSLTRDFYLKF